MDTSNYDVILDDHSLGGDRMSSTITSQNMSCGSNEIVMQLLIQLGEFNDSSCSNVSYEHSDRMHQEQVMLTLEYGRLFYAYFTPVVFVVGLLGNSLSFSVFISRNMRHLSASTYLAALSTSDLFALLFYVMIEWLIRGFPVVVPGSKVSFMVVPGLCQIIMYLHYVSRFLSSWLVVAFTIERYIGVCHPLRRRHICSLSSSRKIVVGIIVVSFVVNIFKPLLSVVQNVELWGHMCTTIPKYRHLSFILDSIYAVSITFVPFVVITLLNVKIIRQLVLHTRHQRMLRVMSEESVIRLEFTSILLVVSFCFVALNLPYFAIWCKLFLTSGFRSESSFQEMKKLDYFRGISFFTRAIFYINYSINFFLYSITGSYFRRELKRLLKRKTRGLKVTCPTLTNKKRFSACKGGFEIASVRDPNEDFSRVQSNSVVISTTWV